MQPTRLKLTASGLAALAVMQQLPSVHAFPGYASKLPNGGAVAGAPAIGHPDAEGLQGLNAFGDDWNTYESWTVAYCQADSDGDGFTNGQELGDPCCVWVEGGQPAFTSGISNPGDKTKTPSNAELKAGCATAPSAGAGTVKPNAGETAVDSTGVMPRDDDEDDSSESAPIDDARRASVGVAVVVVSVVCSVMTFVW